MDAITKSIGSLCVLVYISGILFNLTDISSTQKAIRLTVVLYILSAVLSPVKKLDFGFDTKYIVENDIGITQAQNYILNQAEQKLETDISNKLHQKNIAYKSIDVHINKESESISIDCIEIIGVSENDKLETQQVIGNIGPVIFGE